MMVDLLTKKEDENVLVAMVTMTLATKKNGLKIKMV